MYIYMYQSRPTHHAPDVVAVLHCGVSEVKNYINTVQFLTQTDRFLY